MNRPAQPIRLYRFALSGHCHRVELFLRLLGLPYELVDVDLRQREHKTPEYLAKNAFGQVPVIEDGDVTLADSNAILVYLEGTYAPGSWLPRDPLRAAHVQRWLSVSAGQVAFGPAAARAVVVFGRSDDCTPFIARANQLLAVMEQELAQRPWLAGPEPTLADIANYSYIAHAPEGNVSLEPYPNVRAWLARIEALPGFIPMPRSNVGLRAAA
ncbi:glutathione S-transferase family protein [Ramlibacter sp. PS4R-6]|uniref:glutathione S-transferase family protein n=1 Tax=Ramlibacter sp. PS4R-6 TaxID=3133438 RepID=UPI0030ACDF9B